MPGPGCVRSVPSHVSCSCAPRLPATPACQAASTTVCVMLRPLTALRASPSCVRLTQVAAPRKRRHAAFCLCNWEVASLHPRMWHPARMRLRRCYARWSASGCDFEHCRHATNAC